MIFVPTTGVFPSRTDLTSIVADGSLVTWIHWTRQVVFCPVQATGIAVISATFVGAPIRGFCSVAVFTELGACEEWI